MQLKITSLSPTDFVADAAGSVLGANNPASTIASKFGGAATNVVASISGAVSPILNIGVTVDAVEVDPYRRG